MRPGSVRVQRGPSGYAHDGSGGGVILGGVPRHRPDGPGPLGPARGRVGAMTYLTVAGGGQAEVVVSKSRFLCILERVEDEFSARSVIEQARREHWNARHHCSAFVLGP